MLRPPSRRIALVFSVLALVLVPSLGCASEPPAERAAAAEADAEEEAAEEAPVLTGQVAREELEAALPEWMSAMVSAEIDPAAAAALAEVEPGAEVLVVLGTWCSDSRREVPRLWRALDEVGGLVPFEIEYLAVDRTKEEPAELLAGLDLRYVPTFIVRRDGEEVGRVVESSPNGIERDLLALLTGEAAGVLTGREDAAGE
jgi:thiol-disulfide isomerase/thioredoxin